MKQDIISGRLHPGQKLKIEELRQKYDTGTSPIREALSLLTSDYLVERKDQRGFRVSTASVEKFEELLRTRLAGRQGDKRISCARLITMGRKSGVGKLPSIPYSTLSVSR